MNISELSPRVGCLARPCFRHLCHGEPRQSWVPMILLVYYEMVV